MSHVKLETQMRWCGSCKMCKTTQAKPRIQLNSFSVYAKKRLLERYNPNSPSGKQLSIPNACVYCWCMMVFPCSVCQGGGTPPTLPALQRETDLFLGAVAQMGSAGPKSWPEQVCAAQELLQGWKAQLSKWLHLWEGQVVVVNAIYIFFEN